MAVDSPKFIPGAQAGADLSANQYTLVKQGASPNQFIQCSGATDIPVGVNYSLADAVGDGADIASLQNSEIVKVKVAAVGVSAGDWVGTDAAGLLVTKSLNNEYAIGKVHQAYASGELAEVYCSPGYLSLV